MKLLVAVSNRNLDPDALASLGKLAGEDAVHVLHVGDDAAPPAAVTDAVERLRAAGAQATMVMAQGEPAKVILERAKAENVDLVVVRGHDRHPGLVKRVFGDTVEKVVESCDRPVLALRGITSPEGRHIMLAAGRPNSRMLDVTSELAKASDSTVTLVHVTPTEDSVFGSVHPGRRGAQQLTEVKAAPSEAGIERTLEALRHRGADASIAYREGLVERELADEANSGHYWLTIVRARPVGFLHRLVLGHSFTEDLVRHVGTSVLLLR